VPFCPQKCSGEWVWLRQCLAIERKKKTTTTTTTTTKSSEPKEHISTENLKKRKALKYIQNGGFRDKTTFSELQLSSTLQLF